MTKTEHVYAICYRLEVDDNVISGSNIRTVQSYLVLHFKGAVFSTFRDVPKRSFCDSEIGDGSSGMNVICNRPEVADDVISGKVVDNFLY